jgi:hypothetical protein
MAQIFDHDAGCSQVVAMTGKLETCGCPTVAWTIQGEPRCAKHLSPPPASQTGLVHTEGRIFCRLCGVSWDDDVSVFKIGGHFLDRHTLPPPPID